MDDVPSLKVVGVVIVLAVVSTSLDQQADHDSPSTGVEHKTRTKAATTEIHILRLHNDIEASIVFEAWAVKGQSGL
jgi:hypothetical protein